MEEKKFVKAHFLRKVITSYMVFEKMESTGQRGDDMERGIYERKRDLGRKNFREKKKPNFWQEEGKSGGGRVVL